MLRRFSYLFVMSSLIVMTAYFTTRTNQAADPAATDKPSAPAVPPSADQESDPYAVPEGNDEKVLHLFLTRITKMEPAEPTEAGIVSHFEKLDDAVSQILTREINEDLYSNVAQLRFQIISILGELNAKSAAAREQSYLKLLGESSHPAAKALLARAEMQNRLVKFAQDEPATQQALIDEVAKQLASLPREKTDELELQLDVAMDIGALLEQGDSPLTLAAYKKFSEALKARNDERVEPVLRRLDRTLLRLELPGKEIELASTALTGKPFDIKEYRGKVVLIDFWATWCQACMQELPELESLYQAYHDKGLEVVGINVDEEREIATKFTVSRGIGWVNLFEEAASPNELSPLAARFGVTAFPTMILLDQSGKVVTVQVGGLHGTSHQTSIQGELEKLLGPLSKSATPPAPVELTPPAQK